MKDEIKEILDYLKDDKVIWGSFGSEYKKLDLDEIKLLDYITNLQEELEEEKRIEQASLDTITNLQKEIEEYKEIEKSLNNECDIYMKIATTRGNIIVELEKMIIKQDEEQRKLFNHIVKGE